MEARFSDRMKTLKASDIREILKVTQNDDMISFAGGLPAPELFHADRIADVAAQIIRRQAKNALQYSPTEGYAPLRENIARRMNTLWETGLRADEILITTGSQQGLDLIAKLFLDKDDVVVCESPTYLGAVMSFNVFQPRWAEVPTDDDGMDMDTVERVLETEKKVKFIYTVPNFQNPSGRTWSPERRRKLAALAAQYNIPVIEDNPYGEIRFEDLDLPAIQAMDTKGLVISLGTLSKVFCPGLRIGWIAANRQFLDKFVILKQSSDLHSSTLDQMIASVYIDSYDFEADVEEKRELYKHRCGVMIKALEREMPEGVSFVRPRGGLFLWLELPEQIDSRLLLQRCLGRCVAFVPGHAFFPTEERKNTLRLNFSNMPDERIETGVKRLARAIREMLAKESAHENTFAGHA